jgi:hypothetical protein
MQVRLLNFFSNGNLRIFCIDECRMAMVCEETKISVEKIIKN